MTSNQQRLKMILDTSRVDGLLTLPQGPLDKYRHRASFNWKKMKILLEGESAIELKYKIWSTMEKDEDFRQTPWQEYSREDERRITFIRLKKIVSYQFISEEDVLNEPMLMPAFIAALLQYDTSLCGKKVMSMDNFIQALQLSGSAKHRALIEQVNQFNVLGALTITEMSHGSNVRALRTTATFDPASQSFILHTPDIEATKVWSGILGQTATHAMVYAQLITPDGQSHGPHSFLVPIRDPSTLLPFPGVTVGDMGPKVGMNGMDNGFVLFNQYQIGKDALMNKHADLTSDGRYVLRSKDPRKRFGSSLGILSLGRIFMTYTCALNLQQALTIAIRYAAVRKQFGPPGKPEQELIEYQTHQWRLFPYLAAAYVYQVFFSSFYEDFINFYAASAYGINSGKDTAASGSEIHAISCTSKPVASWIVRDGIQEAREACGGHGYLKAARLNDLRCDHDANNTHEGDSNVILQQTSNYLLRLYEEKLNHGTKIESPFGSVNYLDNCDTILKTQIPADLSSMDNLVQIFQYLVCYLLNKSKQHLDQNLSKTVHQSPEARLFQAKTESQVYHLRSLSIAFFECNSLQRFHRFASQDVLPDDLASILRRLGLLYGLWSLEKHFATLFQAGYLPANSNCVDQARSLIFKLCGSIKDDAVALVDAFAPTDFVLNSVLGYSDGNVYQHIFDALTKNKNSGIRPDWYQEFTQHKPQLKPRSNL